MKRQGKDFSGRDTSLFQTMKVQAQEEGEEPVTDDTENVASVPTHSNDPLLSEKTKTSQAAEITNLKERVKKLEKKGGSRTHRLRRLYKVSRSARVVSSEDEGLDMAEKEADMADKDVSTTDPVTTTGEVVTTANVVVSTAEVTTETLIEIKVAKPKARWVVVQEPSEFTTTTSPSQPS
ncbi:hypothetical protein Tco_0108149 [Tanacetum coccineum]